MVEQVLAPIIPNLGPQAEAMSGAQGISFTATDRQIIKERSGEVDPTKTFKEVFFKRDITHKVENEQSTVNPEMDLRAMESRRKEHKRILKYSAITAPHEHVEISGEERKEEVVMTPPEVSLSAEVAVAAPSPSRVEADQPSVQPAAETTVSQAEPSAAYDQLTQEQKNLESIVSKIKDMHFKRLLCTTQEEFERLTVEIKTATLAAERPEARDYLEPKIDLLTKLTAQYKLKLVRSLKDMHYDNGHKNDLHWLQKMIDKYSEGK
jgi:hypothetical protein